VYRFISQWAGGGDVLDVGCGTGYGTAYLAKTANSVIGIDLSRAAIRLATQRYPAHLFRVMDAQQLSFPNESFDLIVSTENFEHLADQAHHLRELRRVLRPNGLGFIATPNPEMFVGIRNPYHTKENSFAELTALFALIFREHLIVDNSLEPATDEGARQQTKRWENGQKGISSDQLYSVFATTIESCTLVAEEVRITRAIWLCPTSTLVVLRTYSRTALCLKSSDACATFSGLPRSRQ
jgi:ubiquinone/menaquinone biosynthesis C-methylase UbiE